MRIFDDNIFVINLRSRVDRKLAMGEQFHKHRISPIWIYGCERERFPMPELSVKNKEYNGHSIYCCAKTHVSLITSYNIFSKYAIILEDDVILCDDFKYRLRLISRALPEFDLCYIGGHFADINKDLSPTIIPNIWKANNVAGTYGYIINTQSPIIGFIERNWTYDWGWDEFLSNHVLPRFDCYAFLPFLVGHKAGHSDVAMKHVDYNCNEHFQKEPIWK